MSLALSPEVSGSPPSSHSDPHSVVQLSAENARLRAEIEQLRLDRETLKQAVEIIVEMSDSSPVAI